MALAGYSKHHCRHDWHRDDAVEYSGPEQHGNGIDVGHRECRPAERGCSDDRVETEGAARGQLEAPTDAKSLGDCGRGYGSIFRQENFEMVVADPLPLAGFTTSTTILERSDLG